MKRYENYYITDLSNYALLAEGGKASRTVLHSTDYLKRGGENMYYVTGFIGLLLLVAPFVLGYTHNAAAFWTSLLIGAGVLLVSTVEGVVTRPGKWEYWVAGIMGLVALLAPFVFGFSSITQAFWATILAGAVLMLVSGIEVYSSDYHTV